MRDVLVKIVSAQTPDEFEKIINPLLSLGNWRIAETEMSVTDHHYWAMLIKAEGEL